MSLKTNPFENLKETRDNINKSVRGEAADDKIVIGMLREQSLGRTTPEQDEEIALMLPRPLLFSETLFAYEEAKDRGYDKTLDEFIDALQNGNFRGLMIDPRDYLSYTNDIPDALKLDSEDMYKVSYGEVIDSIQQGIGALFKEHDKKEYGVSVA